MDVSRPKPTEHVLIVTPKAIEAIADGKAVQIAVSHLNRKKHEWMSPSTPVPREAHATAINRQMTQFALYNVSYQIRDFVSKLVKDGKITGLMASQVTSMVFVDLLDVKTVNIIAEGEMAPILDPEDNTTETVPLYVDSDGETLYFREPWISGSPGEQQSVVLVPTVPVESSSKTFSYEATHTHVKTKAISVRIRPVGEKSTDVVGGRCCITFYNYPSGVFKRQYVSYSEYIDFVTHLSGPIVAVVPQTQTPCIPEVGSFYQRAKTEDDNDRISRVVTEFILAKGILTEIAEVRTETGADVRVREIRERDITEYERDRYKCMAVQVVYRQKTLAVSYVFYP